MQTESAAQWPISILASIVLLAVFLPASPTYAHGDCWTKVEAPYSSGGKMIGKATFTCGGYHRSLHIEVDVQHLDDGVWVGSLPITTKNKCCNVKKISAFDTATRNCGETYRTKAYGDASNIHSKIVHGQAKASASTKVDC